MTRPIENGISHSLEAFPQTYALNTPSSAIHVRIVESGETEDVIQCPFYRIGRLGKKMTLKSRTSKHAFQVETTVGRVMLSVGRGHVGSKTAEEIAQTFSVPKSQQPTSVQVKEYMKAVKPIAEKQGERLLEVYDEGTQVYFYEDAERTKRARDVSEWRTREDRNTTTMVRYDPVMHELTLSLNGRIYTRDTTSPTIYLLIETFLNKPNTEMTNEELINGVVSRGYDTTLQSGIMMSKLRKFLKDMHSNAKELVESTKIPGVKGNSRYYAFRADVIEIVDKDGIPQDILHPKQPEIPQETESAEEIFFVNTATGEPMLTTQDISVLAYAFRKHARKLQGNEIQAPLSAQTLTQLSLLTEFGDEQSLDGILNMHLGTTLDRLATLFDAENGRSAISEWSPQDNNMKRLLTFLADFDQEDGRGSNGIPRGLDDLRYIFRDNLHPSGGDLLPGKELIL